MIAGLTLRRFYFRIHEGSIDGERAAEFLRALRRHLRGRLLVIWDGAAIHRRKAVKAVLTESRGRLWLERLPTCAPELNPVESLWAHLKEHEIANLRGEHGWALSLHATRLCGFWSRSPLRGSQSLGSSQHFNQTMNPCHHVRNAHLPSTELTVLGHSIRQAKKKAARRPGRLGERTDRGLRSYTCPRRRSGGPPQCRWQCRRCSGCWCPCSSAGPRSARLARQRGG